MNKKLGLLAIPVVVGLGAFSFAVLNPTAHAAPVTAQASSESTAAEAPDAAESKNSTSTDDPNGPNIEQTGQNESAN